MAETETRAIQIELSIDDYGRHARASYFADYLEFRAVLGDRMPMSQLVDMFLENGWNRRDLSLATTSEAFEEPFDEAEEFDDKEDSIAARIGGVLEQRLVALGRRYPFKIEGAGRSAVLSAHQTCGGGAAYLQLLALTLAHTNQVKPKCLEAGSVEDAFEFLVANRLAGCGIPCVVIPTYGAYEEKIGPVVAPLGLTPRPTLAVRSRRAKDGGTDIVCNPPAPDPRSLPGFLLLGQATCGSTETWPSKAKQPDVSAWRKMLSMEWDPLRFLAVPHHVDRHYWPMLSQDSECVVLDRVRLSAMGESTTADCIRIAKAVFGEVSTNQAEPFP